MCEFLVAHHQRGESETGALLGDITLLDDGCSLDPAQLDDFANAFAKVKGPSDRLDRFILSGVVA